MWTTVPGKPDSTWRLTAESDADHRCRRELIADAAAELAKLSDKVLRARVMPIIDEHRACFSEEFPPPVDFPSDPSMLTREEMIRWISEDSVCYEPSLILEPPPSPANPFLASTINLGEHKD